MNPNPDTQKSPQSLREERLLLFWEREDVFKKTFDKVAPMGDFVFFEGPPTANGRPGIHHMAARSFKDVIPRYKTMRGFRVRRKAGWDTHGLPVELQVEKKLGLKSKKEIETYGIAQFNKECRESVWEFKDEWEQMTRRMGYWLDMSDPYITYDNGYIEALWGVVKRAEERGHLYKDFRVVPWCTRCGTTLSSHELNQPGAHKDVKELSVYAKFKIVDGLESLARSSGHDVQPDARQSSEPVYLVAWTTTPWTLPGNVALAVGSDIDYVQFKYEGSDEMYISSLAFYKGKASENGPVAVLLKTMKGSELAGIAYESILGSRTFIENATGLNQENTEDESIVDFDSKIKEEKEKLGNAFKVYAADFVTTHDGTGIVHIAPMYGADDFELATKNNLPKIHTIKQNGVFEDGVDMFAGQSIQTAEERLAVNIEVIRYLQTNDLYFDKLKYEHSYPHCWRCDTPLLYYAHRSWYFRMSALRDQLLAANEQINWEPKHVKEGRFGEWLDGIKDWAISRDRYWGTPLPVWQTEDGSQRVVIGSVEDIKKYSQQSGNKYIVMRHGEAESNTQRIASGNPENSHSLTEAGRIAVLASAQELKKKGITKIFTSPNLRARQTAALVAGAIGIPESDIAIDERIKEFNFGDFEMGAFDAFTAYRDAEMLTMDVALPNGESFQSIKNRVGEFLQHLHSAYANETILMVGHGCVTEVLPGIIDGLNGTESRRIMEKVRLKKGQFREFDFVPLPHNQNYELDFHKPYIDEINLELDGKKLIRTPEVMDVWFDSGAMPYAQDHKLGEAMDFDPTPADYIAEGMDQTRGWFYTMHAVANLVHDNPSVSYKNVVCLGLILDSQGVKMSKSRGNVVNPWDMFDKYGADTIRFWMYSINQPGDSKNFDEKTVDEVVKKVFNLLSNVAKFYDMYKAGDTGVEDYRQSPHVLDQWIIAKTDQLVADVTSGLEDYKMMDASRAIREYIAELSQWYIRRSRDRFKSDDIHDRAYALATTRAVLIQVATLMAPFTPFFAEDLYQSLKAEQDPTSVHLLDWPEVRAVNTDILQTMQVVRDTVSRALEARSKAGIKVRQPLAMLKIKYQSNEIQNYPEYAEIIKDEVNVKDIQTNFETYENDAEGMMWLDTVITPELKLEGQFRELLRGVQELRKTMGLEPGDRVSMTVTASAAGMELINQFKDELMKTAGIAAVAEGEGENEIAVDDLAFAITLAK